MQGVAGGALPARGVKPGGTIPRGMYQHVSCLVLVDVNAKFTSDVTATRPPSEGKEGVLESKHPVADTTKTPRPDV